MPEGEDADHDSSEGEVVKPGAVGYDAIVLAGGRGERLGGVDKGALLVGGRSLLERALTATVGARVRVVVGPTRDDHGGQLSGGARWTREDPPGGGPVAGLVAGLTALAPDAAPWVLVLAVDQPGLSRAVPALVAAVDALDGGHPAAPVADVLCPHDQGGVPQWLLAAYRREALQAVVDGTGTGHGRSVRSLVSGLRCVPVPGLAEVLGDIDTWEDHHRWEQRLS